jgi:CheY-like chemotaxis protein
MANILVVEDDVQVSNLFHGFLTRAGHSVVTVPNGNDAIRAFAQQSFDLIITDIFMPEKDGLEVIRELKLQHPEIKIVAISGGGKTRAPIYLETAKKLGADETLDKPFELKHLIATVNKLLAPQP